jgi:hypothetical protein
MPEQPGPNGSLPCPAAVIQWFHSEQAAALAHGREFC